MSELGRHVPERRCVACGTRRSQADLVRFQLELTEPVPRVIPQGTGRRSGRGAYLCPRLACLDQALRRRAFNRAFRRTVAWDEAELRRAVERTNDER